MTINNHILPDSLIVFQQSFRSIKNQTLIQDLDYREPIPIVAYLNADSAWEKIADSYGDFIKVIESYDHL